MRPLLLSVVAGVLAYGPAVSSAVAQTYQVAQADARQAAAIRHACAVGALTGAQCAQMRASSGDAGVAPGAGAAGLNGGWGAPGGGGNVFSDPQGRYRFNVPDGWNMQVQNGQPSLTQGQAWVQVVTTTAQSPEQAAKLVGGQFQPAFRSISLVNQGQSKFGGHDGYGINAGGPSAAKGQSMSLLIMAISAGGGHDLVIVAAIPVEQAQALNPGVVAMANSVRFQGE